MGIQNIDELKPGGAHITDIEGFIRKRQNKGKTAAETAKDLQDNGFDYHAARALIMMHWQTDADA